MDRQRRRYRCARPNASGLSDQLFYPSWYLDGSRLAAMDGRNLIYKNFDLAGGGAVTTTDHAKVLTGKPSVSPDRKWIASAGQQNAGQPYDQEQNEIWLARAAAFSSHSKPLLCRVDLRLGRLTARVSSVLS